MVRCFCSNSRRGRDSTAMGGPEPASRQVGRMPFRGHTTLSSPPRPNARAGSRRVPSDGPCTAAQAPKKTWLIGIAGGAALRRRVLCSYNHSTHAGGAAQVDRGGLRKLGHSLRQVQDNAGQGRPARTPEAPRVNRPRGSANYGKRQL